MLDSNVNNKPPLRSKVFGAKVLPSLSLNLHTMPPTGGSHFKKWLFLAFLVFGLMAILAFLIFWS